MTTPIAQDRPRLHSHLTKTRFLHIEDMLERGKMRFFIGTFERGKGSSSTAYGFLDVADARVILSDMAWGKAVEFSDYKGGTDGNGVLISRILKIQTREAKYWIELLNGEGIRVDPGMIKLRDKPSSAIAIPLTIFEGRKLAHACLAYLQTWEIARMISTSFSGQMPRT